jgi:PAS domain S-box-containing protein
MPSVNELNFNILNNAPYPILAVNPDSRLRFVNDAYEKLVGIPSAKLIGKKSPHPWYDQEALHLITANFKKQGIEGIPGQEVLYTALDGKQYWFQINIVPIMRNVEVEYYTSNWLNITGRKKAEEELQKAHDELELRVRERTSDLMEANEKMRLQVAKRIKAEKELLASQQQLRDLSAHLESIREKERTLIAREVHDELGQVLTALSLDSTWLANHLSKDQEPLLKKVGAMSELINSTIQTVKRISTSLRPGILDDLGIVAAIEWQSKRFQETTGIKCDIFSDYYEINLEKKSSTAVFRILQEALTNIARHSNAARVKIILKEKNKKFLLTVSDNGQGITQEQISGSKSLGILGMKERALSLGGDLKIKGTPGIGTTITLTIPFRSR